LAKANRDVEEVQRRLVGRLAADVRAVLWPFGLYEQGFVPTLCRPEL
jgi:uncharacterized protein involved in response to NO